MDITALERYDAFDPHIGFTKTKTDLFGYDIYPPKASLKEPNLIKILVTGGSTSTWPGGEWSKLLGKKLIEKKINVVIFNAGMGGYSTSQELLKIVRDGEAIKPDWTISFSGINDMGHLHNLPNHPYVHRYQKQISKYLNSTKAFKKYTFGIPQKIEPYQLWLRNMRKMKAICSIMDSKFIGILQPNILYGDYEITEDEKKNLLTEKTYRDLDIGRTYIEELKFFYDNVRANLKEHKDEYDFLYDYSHIFAGKSNLYRDYRHQNDLGDDIIADKLLNLLHKKGLNIN